MVDTLLNKVCFGGGHTIEQGLLGSHERKLALCTNNRSMTLTLAFNAQIARKEARSSICNTSSSANTITRSVFRGQPCGEQHR